MYYQKKSIESFSNISNSCLGWSCSPKGAFCPPGKEGSTSTGKCCLPNSDGDLVWTSGNCPGLFEGRWRNIATPWLKDIVSYKETIYGVGGGNSIWRRPATKQWLGWGGRNWGGSCCVYTIDVYNDYVYGVGMNNNVYRKPVGGGGWKRLTPGSVTLIKCYGDKIYGKGTDSRIYTAPIGGGTWTKLDISDWQLIDFYIYDDYLYGLGLNRAVYKRKLSGGSWINVAGGSVREIHIYGGYVYGIGMNWWVYRVPITGGGWSRIPMSCCVKKITIADGKMFGLGMNNSLWFKENAPLPYSSNIVTPIGGYKDNKYRALPRYLGDCGTKDNVEVAAKICSTRARENGYEYFGLQCPGCNTQCFAGNDILRAKRYGPVTVGGLGGNWQNYIYKNLPAAEFVDKSDYCTGNPNRTTFIAANRANQYSWDRKNEPQCKLWCEGDENCKMYLVSPGWQKRRVKSWSGGWRWEWYRSDICRKYNNVGKVDMYCDSGPGHAWWGNAKIRNVINEKNIVDTEKLSLPTPKDYYIPKRWWNRMPYTHNCNRWWCPYTKTKRMCKVDFNGYSKKRVEDWVKYNNLKLQDNPGQENDKGDAYISCKALGYAPSTDNLTQSYKKIGWIDQPFSCINYPVRINPKISQDKQNPYVIGGTSNNTGSSGSSGSSSNDSKDENNSNC